MNNNFFHKESVFALICVLLPMMRIIKFVPSLSVAIYYGAFAMLGIVVLMNRNNKINWLVILFFYICFLSILGNDIPGFFHPWERFIGLILIIFCIGPLFQNQWLCNVRILSLNYISWMFMGIGVISFILYIIYRPVTITERGNLFGGITVHSMTMGPVAALAVLYGIQYGLFKKEILSKKKKYVLWIAVIICFFSCLLAGSRAALLSFIGAFTVWIWLYFRNLSKFIRYAAAIVIVIAATSPFWWKYTETIQMKVAYSESRGSMISSRAGRWESRIEEFKYSPFIGYGYGAVRLPKASVVESKYTGTVEPGNGWLFLLSSTGIFSFFIFVLIYCKTIWELNRIGDQTSLLLISSLVFLGIHMMAEGYVISSGSFFFFYLWLCLGTASCYIKFKQSQESE